MMLEEFTKSIDSEQRLVRITVDSSLHSLDAVFGAAYVFIDRCYVWLDKESESKITVELRQRGDDESSLDGLAGEFGNELLAQSARERIHQNNNDLIQAIVGYQLAGAGAGLGSGMSGEPAPLDLSELEALELDDEPFDDPLGISMSWEEKYGDRGSGDAKKSTKKDDSE